MGKYEGIDDPIYCECGACCYWVDKRLTCSKCGKRNHRGEREHPYKMEGLHE